MTDLFLQPLFDWRSCIASPFGPANPTTRHILLTLSLHMSPRGDSCFPSIDLLTEESGLSRRAVVEHLKVAASTGWVGKQDRLERSGQGWRRVEYFSLLPAGVEEKVKQWDAERRALRAPRKAGAPDAPRSGGASGSKGSAPDDSNVVHQVPSKSSGSSSESKSHCPLSADAFDLAIKAYPKRIGNDPLAKAVKAWNARVREGVKPEDMLAGAVRYAKFCEATSKVNTETVMMRATFFGPDKPFEQSFGLALAAGSVAARELVAGAWWKTNDGITAKGKELGVLWPDEQGQVPGWFYGFSYRVFAKAGDGPWMDTLSESAKAAVSGIRATHESIAA